MTEEVLDLPDVDETELVADICRSSFYEFVREFWDTIIQEEPVWNWHIAYLCDELQAVAERVFRGEPKEYDLIVNIPPGTSKPVWEEMPVSMADGTYKKLKYVVKGDWIIGKSGRAARVTAVHQQGPLPCARLTTALGRKIVTALDHPILTADGWLEAGKVRPEQLLALMHRPDVTATSERSDDEFRLAGYLIGDGAVSSGNCNVTGKDPEYLDDLCACVERLGFGYSIRVDKNGVTRVGLKHGTRADGSNKGKYSGVGQGNAPRPYSPRQWVRDIGMEGKKSGTKTVPSFVWEGTNDQVRIFLAAYFQCDGCVSYKDKGKRNINVAAVTISRKLAKGLQRLFLRLGVAMRLTRHVAKNGYSYNPDLKNYVYYSVSTTDQDAAARFLEQIPLIGPKARKLTGFNPHRRTFQQDYLPDRVVVVETVSARPCRCLTVPGEDSFVVDGVVVHNSTVASIMLPAWVWTRMPSAKSICGSYSYHLAQELSRKCRDILNSKKYNQLFPGLAIRDDQNAKNFYINVKGGSRYAVGVGGSVTGFHAHFLIIDDPLDPQEAMSELSLKTANHWMSETLPSRKVDKVTAVTILIMQRLHQGDPTQDRLDKVAAMPVKHICLPAEESERISPPELKARYVDGLMDPVRLNRSVLNEAYQLLGDYGYSGQFQQHPVPRGGGMFQVDCFKFGRPPREFREIVRCWDKAGSSGAKNDWTVGVKMGLDLDDQFWVLDVVRGRWTSATRERVILETAQRDGLDVVVGLEQEPAASGKESAEASVRRLAGFSVKVVTTGSRAGQGKHLGRKQGFMVKLQKVGVSSTDKERRADPLSCQVNGGNVYLVTAPWNAAYVAELRYFPLGKHDDQVDASSLAFNLLAKPRLVAGGIGCLKNQRTVASVQTFP